LLHQVRQHRSLRARLRAHLATEELAVAAVDAAVDRRAVLVGVGLRERRARRRERLVAELLRRLLEERAGVCRLERRIGILARAWAFVRITAGDYLALDVARLAAHAVEVFEAVEVRLELVVGHPPVLARALRGPVIASVAGERAAARLEVPGQEAPREPAPMHGRAADAFAGTERAEASHRQCG